MRSYYMVHSIVDGYYATQTVLCRMRSNSQQPCEYVQVNLPYTILVYAVLFGGPEFRAHAVG